MNRNHLAINRKTFFIIVAVLSLVIYSGFFAHRKPAACSTEKHYFEGKVVDTELCLLRRSSDGIDYMVLRVYDLGLLVAERRFKQYADSGEQAINKLEYKGDEIVYTDADPARNLPPKEYRLAMPPSKWDWLRANYLPF